MAAPKERDILKYRVLEINGWKGRTLQNSIFSLIGLRIDELERNKIWRLKNSPKLGHEIKYLKLNHCLLS
jgi:hypothetical protein